MPEDDGYGYGQDEDRRVHFTPITANLWGGSQHDSTYHIPSKTLAHAQAGTTTSLFTGAPRNKVSETANVNFIDSKGAALKPVHQALFGKSRLARDRIHWMFPPNKDERVSSLLAWIEIMSYNLGAYGLHRFLQSRERGALIANADYRPPQSPNEPAFDWLTFDQLQASKDRTLQESVAFYDPAVICIVFVFLPSKSGNSVAMWRRKISVGSNTRATRMNEIYLAVAGLRREKEYIVHVDELPAKPPEAGKAAVPATSKKAGKSGALTKADKYDKYDSYDDKYDYARAYYPNYETALEKKPKKRKWWHFFRVDW
ncbi:hypothetical protein B0H16DRAFT_1498669 [Mycena metata]|uniref:CcmS related domain-containing protein n=1 Tax=Mycena metata TaxID=1033252 RepID=A0AAD7NZI1_9AGAR|nr:hypothetical protein B0H16DRAFT_1498669 [Mycena metata]